MAKHQICIIHTIKLIAIKRQPISIRKQGK